ncbi:hypothetical protein CMI48_02170 [Candidatus Pacearchaeota archaeon]|nr:hypothetical protein [Candidatus Pacearchaeota archaeon]
MNLRGNKGAFWQALVFTIVVFALGMALGLFIESNRADRVHDVLLQAEISLLDEQLRNRVVEDLGVGCSEARESTFAFADRIFEEAQRLEDFDSSSTFGDALTVLHKRYDLLRLMLWSEAVRLRDYCGDDYHTLVYLFAYETQDITQAGEQKALSRVLLDLKEAHGDEVLLIPIAGNLNIASVDLVKEAHGITSLPAIVVDERQVIEGLISVGDLEGYFR